MSAHWNISALGGDASPAPLLEQSLDDGLCIDIRAELAKIEAEIAAKQHQLESIDRTGMPPP